jgi:DNA-binding NarL/FixJ family response regulator
VIQLVAGGASTKDIARKLHISVRTIDAHRRSIARKLNIRGVADLTKFAIREGLISLDE